MGISEGLWSVSRSVCGAYLHVRWCLMESRVLSLPHQMSVLGV